MGRRRALRNRWHNLLLPRMRSARSYHGARRLGVRRDLRADLNARLHRRNDCDLWMNTRSYEILRALVFAAGVGAGLWALGRQTWLSIVAAFFGGVVWLLADALYRRRRS